ncbi:MAG: helix-turn-helix transcriptional regulator [Gammaproteobacteria bacterium]|nr:helix-turn-helix transcriptional regulator [Gammaproteobacteria bacterium]MCB1923940.1 helix-turn-helix transcriptional regulator [Gammaproteobacteria bacterium]
MSNKKLTDGLPSRRSACPIAAALDLVGDKWSLLLIRDIGLFERHRNKDFQNAAETMPSNILADRLKRMTAYGLLEKRRYEERPPRYEYHLTRQGRELLPVLRELASWSERNLVGVKIPRRVKARAGGTGSD